MPTRPNQPDPSDTSAQAASPFAGLGAGLGFFQDWMKAASSALPNLGAAAPTGTAWAMPTLDPEELDKRIQELKTVQFWLEQNARMIGMSIQTLEVQRMTLQTLRGMKVPMDALRESLKVQPMANPSPAPAAAAQATAPTRTASTTEAPASADTPASDTAATADAAVNPMAWWDTLATQFTALTTQAVQAGQEAMSSLQPASPATAPSAGKPAQAKRAAPKARKTPTRAAGKSATAKPSPKR